MAKVRLGVSLLSSLPLSYLPLCANSCFISLCVDRTGNNLISPEAWSTNYNSLVGKVRLCLYELFCFSFLHELVLSYDGTRTERASIFSPRSLAKKLRLVRFYIGIFVVHFAAFGKGKTQLSFVCVRSFSRSWHDAGRPATLNPHFLCPSWHLGGGLVSKMGHRRRGSIR